MYNHLTDQTALPSVVRAWLAANGLIELCPREQAARPTQTRLQVRRHLGRMPDHGRFYTSHTVLDQDEAAETKCFVTPHWWMQPVLLDAPQTPRVIIGG